ncbi:MAG TPA: hypothetical protein VGE74_02765 [Gemmata sp.]
MERWWFLTWRTYGTWLPGEGGFVGFYRHANGSRHIDHGVGELTTEPIPALANYARNRLVQAPVLLDTTRAAPLFAQLRETVTHRGWAMDALAILPNHVHLVLGVNGDPRPGHLLRDLKSYGSRALNAAGPARTKWWAERGSTRFLKDPEARARAVWYTRNQEKPLLVWLSGEATRLSAPPV